jgi:hypothetical protein
MALRRGQTGAAAIQEAIDAGDLTAIGKVAGSAAVAGLPAAASNTGKIYYCSNGAAGSPCLAYSNGTNWLRITLGAAVSAT